MQLKPIDKGILIDYCNRKLQTIERMKRNGINRSKKTKVFIRPRNNKHNILLKEKTLEQIERYRCRYLRTLINEGG